MPTNIYRAKLVIVGESTVGKTAISQMFITDGREFPKNYNMTLGAEVSAKVVQMAGSDDGVELLVYDTPGSDLYADCYNKFWRRPELLMVVYDVTRGESLHSAADWLERAKRAEWADGAPLAAVLFANKTDLRSRRASTEEEGEDKAQLLRLKYFSGSAKDNQGLEDAFQYLAEAFYKHVKK